MAQTKSSSWFFKTFFGAGLLMFLALLFASKRNDSIAKTKDTPADTTAKSVRSNQKLVAYLKAELLDRATNTFTPNELIHICNQNAAAANTNYRGKKIYIEGTIESIDLDALGKPYVLFKSGDELRVVQAYMSSEKEASNLIKGQSLTMVGIYKGIAMASIVLTEAHETTSYKSIRENLELAKDKKYKADIEQ